MINGKAPYEFFNKEKTYSDLIDRADALQLVEPLDLWMTAKTLDTILDFFTIDVNWNKLSEEFKRDHPLILLRARNMLFTSVMLVFAKTKFSANFLQSPFFDNKIPHTLNRGWDG